MKCRVTILSKPVQHKMYITNLDHGSTGLYASFIVLTVTSVPTVPGVCALNHPAFLQRCEAFRALWTRLHFEAPLRTMLGHPRVEIVIVILLIRKDRLQTRHILGGDLSEQDQGGYPIIETRAGN